MTRVVRHESELGAWAMIRADADPRLRGLVHGYVGWWERTPGPLRRREIPSRDVTLVLNLGPEFRIGGERYSSFVAGLWDAPAIVEHDGVSRGFEVRLSPFGARALLGVPMEQLANRVVELEDVLGPDTAFLVEELDGTPDPLERFALVDRAIVRRVADSSPAPPDVTWAWSRLWSHPGEAISALADELGWSRRHLASRFHDHVGLPPKTIARIARFDRAVGLLGNGTELAEIAHVCGYYDQAHMNRDFRDLADVTPTGYLAARLPDAAGTLA